MTADDFTRVGIGMALVSGFLLAPQLIGIARIQRAEQWAKQRLEKGHWSLHTRARTERDFDPFFNVAPILWWTAIVAVISGLSWAMLGIASYFLLALTRHPLVNGSARLRPRWRWSHSARGAAPRG